MDEAAAKTQREIEFRQFLQDPINERPFFMRPMVAIARKREMKREDWNYYTIVYAVILLFLVHAIYTVIERWILFDAILWVFNALKQTS